MSWKSQGSPTSRGYGWAWQKLRAQILLRDRYICQISLKQGRIVSADQVDHIVSKAEWLRTHGNLDGVDDPSNLQAVCKEEHDKKSILEKGFVIKTGGDVNGMPLDPLHEWNRD